MADVEKDIVLRVKSETDQATGQFKNLKQELRSIENELNKMAEAGQTGTTAFRELQQRAGEVKDQIGDTKNAIKALSSDTFKLDAFADAARGIAGAFAFAQGAASLFAGENEDLQKAILKVQSAMALLQGVTEITNILQKDSAFSLMFLNKNLKDVATTSEKTSEGIRGVGNILTGSLIVGGISLIGILLANWDELFNSVDENEEKMKEYQITSLSAIERIINESRKMIDNFEKFSLILGNKKNIKFYKDQNQLLEYANKQLADKIFLNQKYVDSTTDFYESEIKILQQKKDLSEFEQERLVELQFKLDKIRLVESAREELNKNQLKILENNSQIEAIILEQKQKQAELDKQKHIKNDIPRLQTLKEISKLTLQTGQREKDLIESQNALVETSLQGRRDLFLKYFENFNHSISDMVRLNREALTEGLIDYKTFTANISELDKLRIQGQEATAKAVGDIFGALSDTLGKETKAGKILASAQALINTYLGISEVLRAKNPYPEPFGTAIKVASATAIGIQGFNTVREINKVKVPGGGSGVNPPSSPSFSTAPSAMATTTTMLGTTQLQLDAQGNLQNQVLRTYVLETDISDKQKRSKRLSQTATLGK